MDGVAHETRRWWIDEQHEWLRKVDGAACGAPMPPAARTLEEIGVHAPLALGAVPVAGRLVGTGERAQAMAQHPPQRGTQEGDPLERNLQLAVEHEVEVVHEVRRVLGNDRFRVVEKLPKTLPWVSDRGNWSRQWGMQNSNNNLRLSRPFAIALALAVLTAVGFGGYNLYRAELAYRAAIAATLASLRDGIKEVSRSVEQARADAAESDAKLTAKDAALSGAIGLVRTDLATSDVERARDQKATTTSIQGVERRATATEERIGVAESVITDMHGELRAHGEQIKTLDETVAVMAAGEDPSQLVAGCENRLLELRARVMELRPAGTSSAALASARADLKVLIGQLLKVQLDRSAAVIGAIDGRLVLLEALSVDVRDEETAVRVFEVLRVCAANPVAPIPAELEPSVAARAKECELLVHTASFRASLAQVQAQVAGAMRLPTIIERGVGLSAARENLNRIAATSGPLGVDVRATDAVRAQIDSGIVADSERKRKYEVWASCHMDAFASANDRANGTLWDDEDLIVRAIQNHLMPIDGKHLPKSMQQALEQLMAIGLSELDEIESAHAAEPVTKVTPENF